MLFFVFVLCLGCQKSIRPNILFIMTDQQSLNTIGAYGSQICKTPHIDRIADQGMIFWQCHVASYPCSPSRASILSGLYSHNHGIVTNDIQLGEDLPSLGHLLKKEGYATAYFGKYHLGGAMHRDVPTSKTRTNSPERDRPWSGRWKYTRIDTIKNFQAAETDYTRTQADGHSYLAVQGGTGEDEASAGFDHWIGGWKQYRNFLRANGYDSIIDDNHSVGAHGTAFTPHKKGGFGDSWHAWSILPEEHHQEAFFVNEALAFLNNHWNREEPFGIFLSFYGPHHPLLPPKPWNDMYQMQDVPLPPTINDQRIIGGRGTYRRDQWSDDQFKDYIRRYWGFVSFIDYQIGKLLDKLEQMGELENTIIVFTSDHGDMAGEHGSIYKSTICSWDELMRVPLILSYPPQVKTGSSSQALVSNIDFLPTLLEMIGTKIPGQLDGKSFKAVLENPNREHREILFTSVMGMNFMATDRHWKYNLNSINGHPDELYDRNKDPDEMNNLINDPAFEEAGGRMKDQIHRWLQETGHPYAAEISK